ncbi:MAG TPA: hypothetical protein VGJ86_12230 [Acidimicrobiales bacterium]|jgi:hypothetical protein
MKYANGHGSKRGDRVTKFERRMFRFARMEASFAWWVKVPAVFGGLAIVVSLRQVGLLPAVNDLTWLAGK